MVASASANITGARQAVMSIVPIRMGCSGITRASSFLLDGRQAAGRNVGGGCAGRALLDLALPGSTFALRIMPLKGSRSVGKARDPGGVYYWNRQRVVTGPADLDEPAPLDRIPIFVRAAEVLDSF